MERFPETSFDSVTELFGKFRDVSVPEMYMEQTRRRVLVMEWIEVNSF